MNRISFLQPGILYFPPGLFILIIIPVHILQPGRLNMKKNAYILFSDVSICRLLKYFLLSISIFCLYLHGNQAITITIDTAKTFPLEKRIWGAAGCFNWAELRYGSEIAAKKFREIHMMFNRWPGGTDANAWDWKSGLYKPYSIMNEKFKARAESFNLPRKNPLKKSYTIDDFIATWHAWPHDFSLVLNVACYQPAYTEEMMRYLQKNSVNVYGVEMGNELYFPEYEWAFKTADEYVSRSREHAAAVKKVFPQARIALIFSSHGYTRESYLQAGEAGNHTEDQRTARGIDFDQKSAAADFADFLAIHIYSSHGMPWNAAGKDIIPYAEAYKNAISHFDSQFTGFLAYVRNLTDKKILLSEWRLSAFGGGADAYGNKGINGKPPMIKMYASGLFMINALIEFFKQPQITGTHYWQLNDFWDYENNEFLDGVLIDAFMLFRDAVKNSVSVSIPAISGALTYTARYKNAQSEVSGGGQADEISAVILCGPGKSYLILANKMSTRYELSPILLNQKKIKDTEIHSFEPAGTSGPMAGLELADADVKVNRSSDGLIIIKPFSAYVIEMTQ